MTSFIKWSRHFARHSRTANCRTIKRFLFWLCSCCLDLSIDSFCPIYRRSELRSSCCFYPRDTKAVLSYSICAHDLDVQNHPQFINRLLLSLLQKENLRKTKAKVTITQRCGTNSFHWNLFPEREFINQITFIQLLLKLSLKLCRSI